MSEPNATQWAAIDENKRQARIIGTVVSVLLTSRGHICREHPITLEEAIYEARPADAATITTALSIVNGQPHDPFEGLV